MMPGEAVRKKKRPSTEVYFIQAGADGPIKIGIAGDSFCRLQELQTGHYEELRLLGFVAIEEYPEKDLHGRFADLHIRGEWFRPGQHLLEFIELRACKLMQVQDGTTVHIQRREQMRR